MSHNVPRLAKIIDKIEKLPNVVVRRSSGSTTGEYDKEHGSTIVDKKTLAKWTEDGKPKDVEICPVGKHTGQKSCQKCKKCWDAKNKVIAYVKH